MAFFYQNYWEIISKEVCVVVKEFFNIGELLEDINQTQVCLSLKSLGLRRLVNSGL